MKAKIICLNECIYYFNYDIMGNLFWKNVNGNRYVKNGYISGNYHKSTGYYMTKINGKLYMNHRILYQLYNNITLEPDQEIDHINGITTDNRKENLRVGPHSKNSRNRKTPKNNKSTGLKNISIIKTGEYEYYYIKIIKNGNIAFSKTFPITTSREKLIKIRDEQLKIHHGSFHSLG